MLTLFGPAESVYVRIVRMVLKEKAIDAAIVEFDVFDQAAHPQDYEKLHPFSKAPALTDGDFSLLETNAIVRYLDQKYPMPSLAPNELQLCARMNQAISIVDNYAYASMVWGLYVEQIVKKSEGDTINPITVKASEEKSEKCLAWFSQQLKLNQKLWIVGDGPSLADFYFVAVMLYFIQTDQGQRTLANNDAIANWWQIISSRPSVATYLT